MFSIYYKKKNVGSLAPYIYLLTEKKKTNVFKIPPSGYIIKKKNV